MKQRGQVFELKTRSHGGEAVWAYRYRIAGRDSRRLQRGGFKSERAAREALERALARLRREQGSSRHQGCVSSSISTWRSTAASPRPWRSCAGCLRRRCGPSDTGGSTKFAPPRSRPGA